MCMALEMRTDQRMKERRIIEENELSRLLNRKGKCPYKQTYVSLRFILTIITMQWDIKEDTYSSREVRSECMIDSKYIGRIIFCWRILRK